MIWTVECTVTYHRKWSDIEADTEEEALSLVQDDDPDPDNFPGDCVDVNGWSVHPNTI